MTGECGRVEVVSRGADVEEMMVASGPSGPSRFPVLERAAEVFVASLGEVLSGFSGGSFKVEMKSIEYRSVDEVKPKIGDEGTRLWAETAAWDGQILLWTETPLVQAFLQALMGGASGPSVDVARGPSRLERRIVNRFGSETLSAFADALADIRPLRFEVAMPSHELDLDGAWEGADTCFVLSATLEQGDIVGGLRLILPLDVFKADWEALAQVQEEPNAPLGDGGWRNEMSAVLNATEVDLAAVLTERSISIADALSWAPGTTLDFEIDTSDPVRVSCEGQDLFHAIAGRRANGAVALQITHDIKRERATSHVTSD